MRVGRPTVELIAGFALLLCACGKDKGDKPAKEPMPTGSEMAPEGKDKAGAEEAKGAAPAAGGEVLIWADDKRAAVLSDFATKFASTGGFNLKVQAVSKDL